MRCLKHGPPTLRQRGLNVAATLARLWRELGEELGVGVLDGLARVDAQFLAQQDPEAFIGGKRLGRDPCQPAAAADLIIPYQLCMIWPGPATPRLGCERPILGSR
jgi:hypothetical protein